MLPNEVSEFANGATQHTVLLCLKRQDHTLLLKNFFESRNFAVRATRSVYEASTLVETVLPHLLICDPHLQDGDIGQLRSKMKQNPLTEEIQAIALVEKKTPAMIEPLRGHKWAAILLGEINQKAMLSKISQALEPYENKSQFFLDSYRFDLEPYVKVRFPAEAIGKCRDRIVFRSSTCVDYEAVLMCHSPDPKDGNIELYQAVNLKTPTGYLNLFPYSQSRGPGRKWVKTLPDMARDLATLPKQPQVLFSERDDQAATDFTQVLANYNLFGARVGTNDEAVARLKADPAKYAAVVLREYDNNDLAQRVKHMKEILKLSHRPVVIFQTPFDSTKVDPSIRFIPSPIGLGRLIDAIEAAIFVPLSLVKSKRSAAGGIKCALELNIEIKGLDEQGGLIESPFPIDPGSSIEILSDQLTELLGGNELEVATCVRHPKYWERYQSQVIRNTGGSSRMKFYKQLLKKAGPEHVPEPEIGMTENLDSQEVFGPEYLPDYSQEAS